MTGDEVRAATFRERFRGYDPREVEELRERAANALDRRDQSISAHELRDIEIHEALRGYDKNAVNELFERAAVALDALV